MFLRALIGMIFFINSNAQELLEHERARLTGRCIAWMNENTMKSEKVQYEDCNGTTEKINALMKNTDRSSTGTIDEKKLVELFQALLPSYLNKKRLFWSGTYSEGRLVANYQGGFITLERTLIGYMLDGWTICVGLKEEQMPAWKFCPIFNTIWSTASEYFAETAVGETSVLINASRSPILRPNSVFETKELPALRPNKMKKLTLQLLDAYLVQKGNPCDVPELDNIKATMKTKQILYECVVNPPQAVRAACLIDETRPVCKNAAGSRTLSLFTIIALLCTKFIYFNAIN